MKFSSDVIYSVTQNRTKHCIQNQFYGRVQVNSDSTCSVSMLNRRLFYGVDVFFHLRCSAKVMLHGVYCVKCVTNALGIGRVLFSI